MEVALPRTMTGCRTVLTSWGMQAFTHTGPAASVSCEGAPGVAPGMWGSRETWTGKERRLGAPWSIDVRTFLPTMFPPSYSGLKLMFGFLVSPQSSLPDSGHL